MSPYWLKSPPSMRCLRTEDCSSWVRLSRLLSTSTALVTSPSSLRSVVPSSRSTHRVNTPSSREALMVSRWDKCEKWGWPKSFGGSNLDQEQGVGIDPTSVEAGATIARERALPEPTASIAVCQPEY